MKRTTVADGHGSGVGSGCGVFAAAGRFDLKDARAGTQSGPHFSPDGTSADTTTRK
jgi:hypothetical protein